MAERDTEDFQDTMDAAAEHHLEDESSSAGQQSEDSDSDSDYQSASEHSSEEFEENDRLETLLAAAENGALPDEEDEGTSIFGGIWIPS